MTVKGVCDVQQGRCRTGGLSADVQEYFGGERDGDVLQGLGSAGGLHGDELCHGYEWDEVDDVQQEYGSAGGLLRCEGGGVCDVGCYGLASIFRLV